MMYPLFLMTRFSLLMCAVLSLGVLAACESADAFFGTEPLPHASIRPAPLGFGLHVSPDSAHNPIQPPEEFSGYHVATDFEVTKEELDADVPVYAICRGKVVFSGFAVGYGGLVIQSCTIRGKAVTVLYGHLSLENLPKVKSKLKAGQKIGLLAPARSADSGGNRKHLHLGIHLGTDIEYAGYVQTEEETKAYMNPLDILPYRPSGTGGQMMPYWKM